MAPAQPISRPKPTPTHSAKTHPDPTGPHLSRRTFVGGAIALGSAAPVVAACSSSSGGGGNLSSAGKPVKGGPKTTPNKSVSYPDGYVGPIASFKGPVTTERATLTVVVPQDVTVGDWAKNEFSKWYEKRTNVHVNYKVVGGTNNSATSDVSTKVNAMIGSGDLPDVFIMGYSGFTPSQLLLYGRDQKLFRPLDQYIDDYGVEIKRVFQQYPDSKKLATAPDGKIYTMPDINDCYHCRAVNKAWIYKPWLDELGLKVPETTDELEQVLKAFKTKDPNRNGRSDEVPLTTDSLTPIDTFFMGSFLYNPGKPWLALEDGKVTAVFVQPGWREGLRYMNRLYSQGLIAKQTFTQTTEQVARLGNASKPVLGASIGNFWGSFMNVDVAAKHPRYLDYVAIPTLKGPDGTRIAPSNYYEPIRLGELVVTKASKIPEIAVMWADGLYELEAVLRGYYGPQGSTWDWAKKGSVGFNGKSALYRSVPQTGAAVTGLAWDQQAVAYRSNDFRMAEAVDPANPTFEKPLYENVKAAYHPYFEPQSQDLPPLYMSSDDAGQIADQQETINTYVTGSLAKFVTGKLDPNSDKDWKSYLSTLQSMGLQKYLSINQKAYDSH